MVCMVAPASLKVAPTQNALLGQYRAGTGATIAPGSAKSITLTAAATGRLKKLSGATGLKRPIGVWGWGEPHSKFPTKQNMCARYPYWTATCELLPFRAAM